MADWIPTREQNFLDLCTKWKEELSDPAKAAAFAWEQPQLTAVSGKIDGFLDARRAYEADDSSVNRLAKDEAKEAAIGAMRDFANASIRFNKNMNAAQKLVFGIRPEDKTMTSHGTPASRPDTVVENTVNHFEHKVKALNPETGRSTKPADAYGVRYAWQVGGEKPASASALPKSKFNRKTTLVISHTEADKGTPAYYATCYENSKGDQGKWSPIVEAFIG
ncbi:MAG: hypothetical protein LBC51_08310 [Treponema sp.]|jgi:hypothetical protein|nr:hypothetical protein [Treponema sp.]